MLGSVMDAEDIVHEVFLSLNVAALENVKNTKSYLCKVITNRCIDRLRATSKQREVYVGPWLPEPLVTQEDDNDPYQYYLQKEAVSTAYLLLLQQLSWVERAVFLLREVLQYDYDEIAEIVGKSSTNCRQIFHRAKRSLGSHSALNTASPNASPRGEALGEATPSVYEQTNSLVEQFATALASGNIGQLINILATDVTVFTDGGGTVTAALRPIQGADRVSRFMAGLLAKAPAGLSYEFAIVSGLPGIAAYANGQISNVISFHVESNRIAAIYIVVNPEKLRHVK
jgi:RNA polymerase sigma factor (sigma-70 family)